MNVPLFDLKPMNDAVRDAVDAAVRRVLDSGQYILGPDVPAFEAACAKFLGAPHAVGVSSGTCALVTSLAALGVRLGDEVVVPAFTYGATAMAVRWTGARPVFADIDPATFNLSPDALSRAITKRTRAAIPVHLYGRPADMARIRTVCEDAGIEVVEDAAQSFGAEIGGRQTGTFGSLGCFSFYPTKPLGGFGDAGLVATSDEGLAKALRVIRHQGDEGGYRFERLGGNFRLDTLHAAALATKLPRVEEWRAQRARAAEWYREAFAAAGIQDAVTLPADFPAGKHAWALYTIRAKNRNGLASHLKAAGIGCGVYYPGPLHLQRAFADLGHEAGDFPEAERACAEVLSLPMFAGITQEQVGAAVEAVAAFYRK
jgi:dTDP-4-amino-4,6-dideoxygalactose transaminase